MKLLNTNTALYASILLSAVPFNASSLTFSDLVKNPEHGISYRRIPSASDEVFNAIRSGGTIFPQAAALMPANNRGAPGVAMLDYDNDGDIDVYVTNGPGRDNSLYSNLLTETGKVGFIDIAQKAGVTANSQDSTGVCYGDIDNDGDSDIFVLGAGSSNILYENRGNGKFRDITPQSGAGGVIKYPASCSMGDVNGDGLLDIAVANSWTDWSDRLPLMTFDFQDRFEHNQLLLNSGNKHFKDVSVSSGIAAGEARITWSVVLVDYDQDGDADLIAANDQGPRPAARQGGQDLGYIRVYNNDGTGHFKDMTSELKLEQFGAWMSLAFGDLNHDGHMDMFASNTGDYSAFAIAPLIGTEKVKGEFGASWFFGDKDGGLTRQASGEVGATVFGWGAALVDYDNDTDTDIIYHGGLDFALFQDGSNPGAILNNTGEGLFNRDEVALANSTNHVRRNVKGMAVGDLDNNGYMDIVSVSSQNWPDQAPLVPYPDSPIGGQFDNVAAMWPTLFPNNPSDPSSGFTWSGILEEEGTLSVELNNGENNNKSIAVSVEGTVGILKKAVVNRSGIGAVVSFTPNNGKPAMHPFTGGSGYASQNSHEWVFGLGKSKKGTLSVLWPGGVKNKLYNVRAGEKITLFEIPCSLAKRKRRMDGFRPYIRCVSKSLKRLRGKGVINAREQRRYLKSSIRTFMEDYHKH